MTRGIAKRLMGVQDDNKDTYRRDSVSTSIGSDAIILVEVGLTSYKLRNHDEGRNDIRL